LRFCNLATDKQTNRWTRPSHDAALRVASGGLIIKKYYLQCTIVICLLSLLYYTH